MILMGEYMSASGHTYEEAYRSEEQRRLMNKLFLAAAVFGVLVLSPAIHQSMVMADSAKPAIQVGQSGPWTQPLSCLASLRAALAQYYVDNGSKYPDSLTQLVPQYISQIPPLWKGLHDEGGKAFPHTESSEVATYINRAAGTDSEKWGYINNPSDKDYGTIFIDCSHTDWRGLRWDSF
jgi:hypothetical protein